MCRWLTQKARVSMYINLRAQERKIDHFDHLSDYDGMLICERSENGDKSQYPM